MMPAAAASAITTPTGPLLRIDTNENKEFDSVTDTDTDTAPSYAFPLDCSSLSDGGEAETETSPPSPGPASAPPPSPPLPSILPPPSLMILSVAGFIARVLVPWPAAAVPPPLLLLPFLFAAARASLIVLARRLRAALSRPLLRALRSPVDMPCGRRIPMCDLSTHDAGVLAGAACRWILGAWAGFVAVYVVPLDAVSGDGSAARTAARRGLRICLGEQAGREEYERLTEPGSFLSPLLPARIVAELEECAAAPRPPRSDLVWHGPARSLPVAAAPSPAHRRVPAPAPAFTSVSLVVAVLTGGVRMRRSALAAAVAGSVVALLRPGTVMRRVPSGRIAAALAAWRSHEYRRKVRNVALLCAAILLSRRGWRRSGGSTVYWRRSGAGGGTEDDATK